MKKNLLLATLALLSASGIALAQDNDRESIQFGLKAGFNYANVYDASSEEFDADAKFGFAGGAMLRIPLGDLLGIQPEILYSQKGFEGRGTLLGSPYHFTRTTSFIDIPILIALKPNEFITVLAGPQYSYLLRRKDEFTNTSSSVIQEQEFKNDNIRKNIFGLAAGLDFNINQMVIGARMCWDIQNNNGDGTSNTPRYKNVWFQGTVGFVFN